MSTERRAGSTIWVQIATVVIVVMLLYVVVAGCNAVSSMRREGEGAVAVVGVGVVTNHIVVVPLPVDAVPSRLGISLPFFSRPSLVPLFPVPVPRSSSSFIIRPSVPVPASSSCVVVVDLGYACPPVLFVVVSS
jgi:hypothetical protein